MFSLKNSSLLSTRNIGHFGLFMLFTCSSCTVVSSITCFSALYIGHLVLILLFLLVFGTQLFLPRVLLWLVSGLIHCYNLLSFDFVSYSRPGFEIIVLVSLVPHINGLPCPY